MFGRAVDRIQTIRVLLLVTFRPEFQAPWAGRPYVTSLMLNRLTEREAREMIDRIVGNKVLPLKMRRDIIERADGIPLFVEEMTKAVLEAESEAAVVHAISVAPSPAVEVSASLRVSHRKLLRSPQVMFVPVIETSRQPNSPSRICSLLIGTERTQSRDTTPASSVKL